MVTLYRDPHTSHDGLSRFFICHYVSKIRTTPRPIKAEALLFAQRPTVLGRGRSSQPASEVASVASRTQAVPSGDSFLPMPIVVASLPRVFTRQGRTFAPNGIPIFSG